MWADTDPSHVRNVSPRGRELGGISVSPPPIDFWAPSGHPASLDAVVVTSMRGVVAAILFDYVIREGVLSFEVPTPSLASGRGKAFSNADGKGDYLLCSGPAPAGYTLTSHSFELDKVERRCGDWATCVPQRADDKDACWAFAIQGYEDRDFRGTRLAHAAATLSVAYRLIESQPTLR